MKTAESSRAESAKNNPAVIKRGSVTVKVYRGSRLVQGTEYPLFTVSYYNTDGKRIRKTFADAREAKEEAELTAAKLSRGQSEVLTLTGADRGQYLQALESLKPLNLPLTVAVDEFAAAKHRLPLGVTLITAVDEYTRRHSTLPKTVPETVNEMLEDRRAAGCSSVHLRDLDSRLNQFAELFPGRIESITPSHIRNYLRGLTRGDGQQVTNRTRRNVQRIINCLFHFARKRRYVLRDVVDEICEIESPKVGVAEIGVFTPEQMRKMLNAAPVELKAVLAIGGFCGLRTAELQRLQWRDVKLSQGVITVGADKSKTASRRVVPISDNCAQWLVSAARSEGPVSPAKHDRALNNRLQRLMGRIKMNWVRNGLRHSFCSYRLAVTHDPARVATEAGNSPNMIHRHYKALVTEKEGNEWFSIFPRTDALPVTETQS